MKEVLDPQWYALRVMPQREYVVAELLRRRGLSTLIPTEIRTHKRASYSKGKAEFAVPIMPGCVFTGFPSAPAWFDLLDHNHLIIGPMSLTSDGQPSRLNFVELVEYFSDVNDGCMVRDGGLRLVHIPGRGPVRPLVTRTKIISAKKRAATKNRPLREVDAVPVQKAPKRYADFLSRFVHGGSA